MSNLGFHEYYHGKYPVIEYTLDINIEDYKTAEQTAQKILSRQENKDIEAGIIYSFLIENGKDHGTFRTNSTFLYPTEETMKKLSNIIKDIGDSISIALKENNKAENKSLLRTSSYDRNIS